MKRIFRPQLSKFFHKKISYIFAEIIFLYFLKKTFLIFRKRNFLIFRERYIQNHGICITRGIFRKLSNIYDVMFAKNSYLAHFLGPSSKNKKRSPLKKVFPQKKKNVSKITLSNLISQN